MNLHHQKRIVTKLLQKRVAISQYDAAVLIELLITE